MHRRFIGALALIVAACDQPAATSGPPTRPLILEERDGLWIRDSAGARRLTALRVAGFDYDSLAALQREGAVILYWAAAPTPSPDGGRIAYASNREAVATDTSGQSIWLLDLEDGSERPLLHRAGRSYRPVGWLADDVVFIGDEPGVHAVDPETGRTRLLAPGTWIAGSADAAALAVADGLPDSARVSIVTADDVVPVPDPPPGYDYLPEASFVAGSRMLLLEAGADSGRTRAFLAFDIDARRLFPLNPDVEAGGRVLRSATIGDLLGRALGPERPEGRVFCSWRELGQDENAAYVWALCEDWAPGADSLVAHSGRSVPVALQLARSGDRLAVSELRMPRDGSRHEGDLRAIFPDEVRRRMRTLDAIELLGAVNRLQARRCYERSSIRCLDDGA